MTARIIPYILIACSSVITWSIFSLHISNRVFQSVMVISLGLTFTLVGSMYLPFLKRLVFHRARGVIVFLSTFSIQITVLATGGVSSQLLVLIHLFTLGLSLFYRFSVAVFFLLCSLALLFFELLNQASVGNTIINDPGTIILYGTTFFVIVPLAQILSSRYHGKDTLFRLLTNEVKVEESILSGLQELVFVVDKTTAILSVNDAAEKTLLRSRTELLNHPLFDVIFLKDTNGKLFSEDALRTSIKKNDITPTSFPDLLLFSASGTTGPVTLQVKPIMDLEGIAGQMSIIISESNRKASASEQLQEARLKYEANLEVLKKTLYAKGLTDLGTRLLLLGKIEQDMQTLAELDQYTKEAKTLFIDLAKLCQETVTQQQDFANSFGVELQFSLKDFGIKEIEKLGTKFYNIDPQQVTGPFFTAACDVKQVGLLLQKLLDIVVLIAAGEEKSAVEVSIGREVQSLLISITGSCTHIPQDKLENVFMKSYGQLSQQTKLSLGSGMEGYIAKLLATRLNIPLQVKRETSTIIFSLRIPKSNNLLSLKE